MRVYHGSIENVTKLLIASYIRRLVYAAVGLYADYSVVHILLKAR